MKTINEELWKQRTQKEICDKVESFIPELILTIEKEFNTHFTYWFYYASTVIISFDNISCELKIPNYYNTLPYYTKINGSQTNLYSMTVDRIVKRLHTHKRPPLSLSYLLDNHWNNEWHGYPYVKLVSKELNHNVNKSIADIMFEHEYKCNVEQLKEKFYGKGE